MAESEKEILESNGLVSCDVARLGWETLRLQNVLVSGLNKASPTTQQLHNDQASPLNKSTGRSNTAKFGNDTCMEYVYMYKQRQTDKEGREGALNICRTPLSVVQMSGQESMRPCFCTPAPKRRFDEEPPERRSLNLSHAVKLVSEEDSDEDEGWFGLLLSKKDDHVKFNLTNPTKIPLDLASHHGDSCNIRNESINKVKVAPAGEPNINQSGMDSSAMYDHFRPEECPNSRRRELGFENEQFVRRGPPNSSRRRNARSPAPRPISYDKTQVNSVPRNAFRTCAKLPSDSFGTWQCKHSVTGCASDNSILGKKEDDIHSRNTKPSCSETALDEGTEKHDFKGDVDWNVSASNPIYRKLTRHETSTNLDSQSFVEPPIFSEKYNKIVRKMEIITTMDDATPIEITDTKKKFQWSRLLRNPFSSSKKYIVNE